MLGRLIETLDDPDVAFDLARKLDQPELLDRLMRASQTAGREPADYLASTVRNFVDTATDDHWLQLIGIMNRAEDPGLAAIRAILEKAFPKQNSSTS